MEQVFAPASPAYLSKRHKYYYSNFTAIEYFLYAIEKGLVKYLTVFSKRTFDIFFSVLGIALFLPIYAIVALLIRMDSPGPILFRQCRVGKYGRHFMMYKFRTMYENAETKSGPAWAGVYDPRVTKFGRILRKTHIDELLQLINVLKGEMSFVGPRPERPVFVRKLERLISNYNARLDTKPGITGLAQIRHKYDESLADVRRKVKYDLFYIDRTSLILDISILFQTFLLVFKGKSSR